MIPQINIADFRTWEKDPVTVAVMAALTVAQDRVDSDLSNPNVLLGNQLQIARCVGIKEALQLMLDIGYEDLGETNEVDASRT